MTKRRFLCDMALVPVLSFPDPPARSRLSAGLFAPGSLVSACCSLVFHSLLVALAIGLSLGGGAGATGCGQASGKGGLSAGLLILNSGAAKNGGPRAGQESAAGLESSAAQAVRTQETKVEPRQPEVAPKPAAPEQDKAPVRIAARQREKTAPQALAAAAQQPVKKSTARRPAARADSGTLAEGAQGSGNGNIRASAGGGKEGGTEAGGGGMPAVGLHSGAGGQGNQGSGFGGKVDSKPRILSRLKVKYPERARKSGISGQVLLRFHLDEQGAISRLQVVKAEPPGIFEDAALASVRQWRFAPAMKDGRPVPYWVELPMPFILK